MKQKVAIARCLLHDPAYVFLDEPTSGLDPTSSRNIRDLISLMKKEGKTIILCTHNLYDASRLCDKVAIIQNRLLYYGLPTGDRKAAATVEIDAGGVPADFVSEVRGVDTVAVRDGRLLVTTRSPDDTVPLVVSALTSRGIPVRRVADRSTSLEELYYNLAEKNGNGKH
jgi:ABC-2 type transport system ATP-binding protein